MTISRERAAVVIVGGGPSGLRAAAELAPRVAGNVVVLERESDAGGIPRHCHHTGFGLRDLRRMLSGPAYAARMVDAARGAGAQIRTNATVTGWADERSLEVTSPSGRCIIDADAVVLATGARERARAARRIPGDRPAGIYTTGQLQNAVHLHHQSVGTHAVIVGAEAVSWSAVLTLRHAGCVPVLLTSEFPQAETYAVLAKAGRIALRTGVRTRTRVVSILGRGRVSGVVLEHLDTGARETVACDTVVFTADWIPDNELVRSAGIELNAGTLGPRVDTALRTSREGVFAVGNMTHPVDTADVAALDGAHVAWSVLSYLRGQQAVRGVIQIVAAAPLRWVSPSLMHPDAGAPARARLSLWSDEFRASPSVIVQQGGQTIAAQRLPWPAAPGRVFRVPWRVMREVRADGGDVTVLLG